jgi:hypothetical protein
MKDGGSAFPVFDSIHAGAGVDYACVGCGMTLRDWFAGQALAGLAVNSDICSDHSGIGVDTVADYAYRMADAMLDEWAVEK